MAPRKPSAKALTSVPPDARVPPGPVAQSDPDALAPLQDLLDEAVILHGVNLALDLRGRPARIHGGHVVTGEPPTDLPPEARPAFDALTALVRWTAELAPWHGVVFELDLLTHDGVAQLTWGFPERPAGPDVPPPIERLDLPVPAGWRPHFVPSGYPVTELDGLLEALRALGAAVQDFNEAQLFVRTERAAPTDR